MKKSRKWLWLVIAIVAVLAVVGVVLGIVLSAASPDTPEDEQGDSPKGGRADLYWNIDRALYANADTGMSAREPGADGKYHLTFAHEGEQKEFAISDKRLVNYIDTVDAVGLVFDDNGQVVDAVDVTTIAKEIAKNYYVVKVEGNVITLNGSLALDGMVRTITCEEITKIYSLVGEREYLGEIIEPEDLKPLDRLQVYGNDLEQATHIGVMYSPVDSAIYWRINQFYNYDVNVRSTTREPDENGVYTIDMFCNGEIVKVKSKDKDVVTKIDSVAGNNCHFGLIFDRDGYVIGSQNSPLGVRGRLACSLYDVTALDGRTFTATKVIGKGNDLGSTYTNTIPEGVGIYDISSDYILEHRGKAVDNVQLGDRVFVWEDTLGNIVEIIIYNRLLPGPVYYRMDTLVNRKPDENGWYVFEIFNGKKVVNYKTKDEALAKFVEGQRFLGLQLDGDVITYAYVYSRSEAPDYTDFARYNYNVSSVAGLIITLTSPDGNTMLSKVLSAKAKVYNLSGIHQEMGAETTLLPGDRGYFIFDAVGELTYAFVTNRKVEAGIYYNLSRMYNATGKCTSRVPDENGYYVFQMAHEGKVVTIKTKSKAVATKIDKVANCIVGLNPNKKGVVTDAYNGTSASGGSTQAGDQWTFECYAEDGRLQLYRPSAPEGKLYLNPSPDMEIYNVGNIGFSKFRGEADKVEKGDKVLALTDANNKVVVLYITGHIYKNTIQYCEHCKKHVEFTPWAGTNMSLVKGKVRHYYIPANVENAEFSILGDVEHEKDNQIVVDLNGKTLRFAENARGFMVYNGVKMSVMDSKSGGKMISSGPSGTGGMFLLGANGTLTLYSGTLEMPKDHGSITAGGVIHMTGAKTVLNIRGGKLSSRDGKIEAAYVEAGTVNITGGQITGLFVKAGATVNLSGTVKINKLQLQNGMLLDVSKLNKKSAIGIVARGVFTTELTNPADFLKIFSCPVEGGKVVVEDKTLACYGADPDYTNVYETAQKMDFSNTEKLPKTCPYCDRNVVWQPLPKPDPKSKWGNNVVLGGGLHYYLPENRAIEGMYMLDGGDICLHLNGKTITSTGGEIFSIFSGKTLTIMGDGTVKGSGASGGNSIGSVIANSGTVNLCGGTYEATEKGNLPIISCRGTSSNEINIYDGVVKTTGVALRVGGQRANIYGGTVNGSIFTSADKARVTVSGGNLNILDVAEGKLEITGGSINKLIVPATLDALKLSGTPVIGVLNMTEAAIKVQVDQLAKGAKIGVDANGVFTAEFADEAAAQAALAYFGTVEENATLWRDGKVLGCTPAPFDLQAAIDAINAMTFTGETSGDAGYCYFCEKDVTWKPLTEIADPGAGHFYLADDLIRTPAADSSGLFTSQKICLHLNGHKLEQIGSKALAAVRINAGGVLNIMGNGQVHCPAPTWAPVAVTGGVVNVYGGEYFNNHRTNHNVFFVGSTGTLNIYDATVSNASYCVATHGATKISGGNIAGTILANKGTLVIEGGNIGTITPAADLTSITVSGNAVIGTLNADGRVTIEGGRITKLVAAASAGTIKLVNAPVVEAVDLAASAIKLDLTGLTAGASIHLGETTGVFTTPFESKAAAETAMGYIVTMQGMEVSVTGNNELSYGSRSTNYTCEELIALSNAMTFTGEPAGDAGYCYHCNKAVTWKPLTEIADPGAGHFYLADDLIRTPAADSSGLFTSQKICLHLNGHKLEQIGSKALAAVRINAGGVLNIMGNGQVHCPAPTWAPVAVTGGVVNVYGGEYFNNHRTNHNVFFVGSTGTLNIYDATVSNASYCVATHGTTKISGGNIAGTILANKGTLAIEGGNIGAITLAAEMTSVTVSGKPVIGNLNMTGSTVKLNVGTLITGASIGVTAEGVFTGTIQDVSVAKTFFSAVVSGKTIQIVGQTLSCVNAG